MFYLEQFAIATFGYTNGIKERIGGTSADFAGSFVST